MSLPLFAVKLIYELNLTNISKYERIYLVVVAMDVCICACKKCKREKNEQNEANKRALNKSSNTKIQQFFPYVTNAHSSESIKRYLCIIYTTLCVCVCVAQYKCPWHCMHTYERIKNNIILFCFVAYWVVTALFCLDSTFFILFLLRQSSVTWVQFSFLPPSDLSVCVIVSNTKQNEKKSCVYECLPIINR